MTLWKLKREENLWVSNKKALTMANLLPKQKPVHDLYRKYVPKRVGLDI
jgi:hypothetical protein